MSYRVEKPKWPITALFTITFQIWELIVNFVFWLMHRNAKKTILPAIDNPLLLESATNLAFKIRTQKVDYNKGCSMSRSFHVRLILQVKSEDVVKAFIDRIKAVNPVIVCMVDHRFDSALEEARRVDQLIASGTKDMDTLERETPFLGVPFTCKDCFAVKGMDGVHIRHLFYV